MTAPREQANANTNALLRLRLEEMTAAYEWMNKQTARIQQEMSKLTGSAESRDGTVSATVGPRGQLVSLTLDPRSSRRVSTEELAESIMDTVNRAAKQAQSRMVSLVSPILPDGVSADEIANGTVDPASWMPNGPLTDATFDAWWSTIRKKPEGRQ
jgi:DNA-binding protein YbaB